MSWSSAGLPVIEDQTAYWTYSEAAYLFLLPERELREAIARAGIPPAGRRPGTGRGRTPLVFSAEVLVDAFSSVAAF